MSLTATLPPEDYYRRHFIEMLSLVLHRYRELLSEQECAFAETCLHLEDDAQKLYVRLLCRKGDYFPVNRIRYHEIGSLPAAIKQLQRAQLASCSPHLDLEILLPLFTKSHWASAFSRPPICSKLNRTELWTAIRQHGQREIVRQKMSSTVVQLHGRSYFDLFRLLYFGNLRQHLNEFVLSDIGTFTYEAYRVEKHLRLFNRRSEINAYLHYARVREQLDSVGELSCEELYAVAHQLPESDELPQFIAGRIAKLRFRMGRELERRGNLKMALDIYQRSDYTEAYERIVRIHIRLDQPALALSHWQALNARALSDAQRDTAHRLLRKIKLKQGLTVPPTRRYQPMVEQILQSEPGNFGVERHMAEYLSNAQQVCLYVENALVNAVLGLHYWEVIYAPVPGAFSNPYQVAPHDLYHDTFIVKREQTYHRTRSLITEDSHWVAHCKQRWREKFGIANPFVAWSLVPEALLAAALETIPAAHWLALFDRIWENPKCYRSGLPDLIQFDGSGGYALIEIKAPGDRLQQNQLHWMAYFRQHEIPHKVIQVRYGDNA